MRRFLIVLFFGFMMATPALATEPDEVLDDPAEEARAREVSKQLRCVVCQNQSIDDSDAPLAKDLRLLVRERIEAGDTNEEVLDYVVARYGEFVLLKPRFEGEGVILWIAPFLLLVIGGGLAFYYLRTHKAPPVSATPLTAEEEAELKRLMEDDKPADQSR